jgi:hypothetical protein
LRCSCRWLQVRARFRLGQAALTLSGARGAVLAELELAGEAEAALRQTGWKAAVSLSRLQVGAQLHSCVTSLLWLCLFNVHNWE